MSIGLRGFAAGPEPVYHPVTNPGSPVPMPGVEHSVIPRLAATRAEWLAKRPELIRTWTSVLGKLEPTAADRRWFGDIRQARILSTEELPAYTRVTLELPSETDYWKPYLLLLPKTRGRHPAVIAWTSTTPDWRAPEQWWGAWLAERGAVVLIGWSHIRGYRDGATFRNGVGAKVAERFGRWSGLSRMVWDVRREAEFLASRAEVDKSRIAFLGFSLSAKAAVYVGAFAPEIAATVAIDPHIALNGGTNYWAPWYMEWTPEVLGLLDPDPAHPGFEHDHHELLALAAPRPFLLIGGSLSESGGGDSDDRGSAAYVERAREIYRLYGAADRLEFVLTADGHHANGPHIDPAWQRFLTRWLRLRVH